MKTLLLALLALPLAAQAGEVRNDRRESNVSIARVVEVKKLEQVNDVVVNYSVQDLGGSTDLSPTQVLHLSLYRKGEMFNVDASFPIAHMLSLKTVRRVAEGRYQAWAETYDEKGMRTLVIKIDARHALAKMQAVECEDFDCDAAVNFQSSITITELE